MAIIEKYQDVAGKWRVLYEIDNSESKLLKFDHNPTDLEIINLINDYLASPIYILRGITRIQIIIENYRTTIDNATAFIKTTNPNMTQWNNYLSELSWYNSSIIRWFTFSLAVGLASNNEINLANYTEAEVLGKLKTWIIDSSVSKLKRIIWGE